jgi:YfiR/HmsC-like
MRSATARASHGLRWLVVACLVALVARIDLASADTDDRRALVVLRVLAYDKHLGERVGDVVRVVVVYPKGDDDEAGRWRAAFAKISKLKVDGRSVVIAAQEIDKPDQLGRALANLKPAALIACDGIAKRIAIDDIAKATRANHVLSFTTRASEVEQGLAVGIVPGKEHDEIVVNMTAAAAEGVKFDAGLLQLARTVRGSP